MAYHPRASQLSRRVDHAADHAIDLDIGLNRAIWVDCLDLAAVVGTAMLEEVIQFGTGIQARALGRPAAGKTGTTQDYTDAWFVGFTPQLTAGVWVGFDDKQISLGKKETGELGAGDRGEAAPLHPLIRAWAH